MSLAPNSGSSGFQSKNVNDVNTVLRCANLSLAPNSGSSGFQSKNVNDVNTVLRCANRP
jgi:SUMO ligase MMS21 Smc5/6 complex component